MICVSDESLVPIGQWLEENAPRHYSEWLGLMVEGPSENGYLLASGGNVTSSFFLKCFGVRKQKINHIPFLPFLSKARRAFNAARSLYERGIPTPEPVAYSLLKRGPNAGKELVFTRFIDDAQPMDEFCNKFLSQPNASDFIRKKRELTVALAGFVKGLHLEGVYHGDFDIFNILTRYKEGFEFYLIDTGGIRSIRGISHRRRIKNLERINRFFLDTRVVSSTDRMRFLRIYLGGSTADHVILKKYWREIEQRTILKLKKNVREFKEVIDENP
ncbi:MAG: lipopolysaccharide kinase InaA family protein [Deltaproteobacteria bacterium]|nr:lipopolysaccharide kinase InaA family protein [Deltaproteobacteria bacterium]